MLLVMRTSSVLSTVLLLLSTAGPLACTDADDVTSDAGADILADADTVADADTHADADIPTDGAGCPDCTMDNQLELFAAAGAAQCGTILATPDGGEGLAAVQACVDNALSTDADFVVRQIYQGIEGQVETAWLHANGELLVLFYDSTPCGGDGECSICGPRVQKAVCHSPVCAANFDMTEPFIGCTEPFALESACGS